MYVVYQTYLEWFYYLCQIRPSGFFYRWLRCWRRHWGLGHWIWCRTLPRPLIFSSLMCDKWRGCVHLTQHIWSTICFSSTILLPSCHEIACPLAQSPRVQCPHRNKHQLFVYYSNRLHCVNTILNDLICFYTFFTNFSFTLGWSEVERFDWHLL